MVAAMKWLLVALCFVTVSCLPAEELQQDAKLGPPDKAAVPRWRGRWRLPSWYRKYRPQKVAATKVETSRVISEPENVVQSDEAVASWNAEQEGTQTIERRWVRPTLRAVFKATKGVIQWAKDRKNRKGKRDLSAVEGLSANDDLEDDEDIDDADAEEFVSEAVDNAIEEEEIEQSLQDAAPTNLRYLLFERVVRAEKYELARLNINKWFENKHDGVVVTLANRRRLLILKGYEFFREEPTVVLDAEVMTDVWSLLETKDPVENSTLGDYVQVNEESCSSRDAAENMMALN